jgi:tetratricopeptide (TPR) repeat protein
LGEGEFALGKQNLEIALGSSVPWAGDHDFLATLVDNAAIQRDEAVIRQYAPRAEALANELDHRLYQATVHRAWGVAHRLAGEYAESDARLNLALEQFSGLGTRWQRGRTLFELGELAVARQRPADARDYFSRALVDFDAMRAAPDSARTRAALEPLRETV